MIDGVAVPRRHFAVAVNAESLALAWARQEAAPVGATVTVDHEISPRGRLGRLWDQAADKSAILAMVWRPTLAVDASDLVWSAASLGLLRAIERTGVTGARLQWPDKVVDESYQLLGAVKAEIQLGPGRVDSAIITARVDLDLIGRPTRSSVLEALAEVLAAAAAQLDKEPDALRGECNERCALTGRDVIAYLLPRGEIRGVAGGVDSVGALVVRSATGLRQVVPILGLDRIALGRPPS